MEGVEEDTGLASTERAPGAAEPPTVKTGAASELCCPVLSVGIIFDVRVVRPGVSGPRFSAGVGAGVLFFTGVLPTGFLPLPAALPITLGLAEAPLLGAGSGALVLAAAFPAVGEEGCVLFAAT